MNKYFIYELKKSVIYIKLALIIIVIYSIVFIQDARSADFGSRYLSVGETWNLGNGFSITAQSIDAKAVPKQVWLNLSDLGVKLDDKVLSEGAVYSYIPTGSKDAIFSTTIASIQAGSTSDTVLLTNTYTERPAASSGSISVSSTPSGASIYLDGNYQGITPKTIFDIPVGSHTIKISKQDYDDLEKTVTVASEQTTYISETLKIKISSIEVISNPDRAYIYLDSIYKGTTPKTIFDIPVGSHTIKISKQDYNDIEKTVTITAGQTTYISENLIHQIGSVIISSDPTGADIYLDGVYEGITPKTITSVSTGIHSIVLKKIGYDDFYQSIYIEADSSIEVNPSMKLAPALILIISGILILSIIGIVLLRREKKPKRSREKKPKSDSTQINNSISKTVPLKTDGTVLREKTVILRRKYQIVRLLKSGGMGFVYEGEYNGNKCIIKEPKSGEGIKESNYFLDKIKIEAEILSKIKHDNIVGYIDSFEERNSFFLVEKYVEGEKLGDKYLNNPGSEDEVISYTLQLLNAVAYLHNVQIKHRDINPNNLILTPNKKLILIDFGTAKYFNTGRKETKGMLKSTQVGTPYFAPPEQWEGDTSEVSDIFSIGRTMYFMLTGENPTNSPYKRLDFLGKKISKELADFVIKAAEPEVKDRYESAVQMINLLNIIKASIEK